ncbi:DNA translocase FtsK 4TM domain-containing protein [Leptospira sp. 2 VSF19]|uniref:DNA translocase FtsK 4TM domain-containing protein n=1 Tax=Leptospira soteropolitanensis TaxID=2950025 RepID=A0AAW5VLB4_9LEPT|nr:DNA translocase FtsK [Leptospira soteropolitanensis]MCW7492864.1 DNA translocase FtsK 4TM domain-containing protein [Leptospira soteropolitanensis]MCW7500099.1 DNA translocase FtsK 4TM domain-containing protein [Leptospira soteropolitanensis]MCW7522350.1 DNA translocase FtsK 4TM domain-containing protein [Leptospira soteropolitanensis]MCW7526206.1 DNA translocase FtsK 4TM domain-containing protein [Leptospira soteropolitanensis]MCW7529682.1 DNA translocase FtsK 4TM domain-containing protein
MDPKKSVWGWTLPRKDFLPYLLVFSGVFLLLSLFSFQEGEDGSLFNWFGRLGHYIAFTLLYILGKSSFLLAGFVLMLGVLSLRNPDFDRLSKALFFPLFLVATTVSLNLLETPLGHVGDSGGILGQFFSWVFSYLFGETGRILVVFFLYLYFAVIWLEDGAWSFTFAAINKYSNGIYKMLGGRNDLPHLRLPQFLESVVSTRRGSAEEIRNKQWFAVQTEEESKEDLAHHFWNVVADEKREGNRNSHSRFERSSSFSDPNFSPEKKFISKDGLENRFHQNPSSKKTPSVRYRNTSHFEGFFDEAGKVFRFQKQESKLDSLAEFEKNEILISRLKLTDNRRAQEELEEIESKRESKILFQFPEAKWKPKLDEGLGLENLELPKLDPVKPAFARDTQILESSSLSSSFVYDEDYDDLEEDPALEIGSENEKLESNSSLYEKGEDNNPSEAVAIPESVRLSLVEETGWDVSEEESSEEEDGENIEVYEEETLETLAVETNSPLIKSNLSSGNFGKKKLAPKEEQQELMFGSMVPKPKLKKGKYYISPRLLVSHQVPVANILKNDSELDLISRKIEESTGHFGIESKVITKERGPIITRYEITIPNGIKLNRIVSLSDEIRAYLEVKNIRIVAPIPGKASIGIEVPNRIREDVFLSEILKDTILQQKAKDLSICIGKDISGKLVMIDIAKLPHLLVAGTTGSGKSVSINAMITSLICTRSPEEVRFIMIDPKMVEMTLYEGIPHLLMPVITDPKKATKALSWAIQEMESRYQMISQLKSRDFKSFNEKVDEYAHAKGFQKLPYIVIFIDELADLMMVSGKDLEEQIQRISQKARAVGIHLVMATQRPSVDVITGVIKANCPARVAFQVAQKTDSRTILDTSGAETLLGKGDFLYRSPTSSDLQRIQAPFIEEKEIESIVEEAKKQGAPAYVEMNWDDETSIEMASDEDEELFDEAWNIVVTEKKASASYLQRRMRIGYNKAARLMELMEMRGYVSPQVGAKPREILRSA